MADPAASARPDPAAGPGADPPPGSPLRIVPTAWGVRLVLDRPAKLNALDHGLVEALDRAVVAAAEDRDVRVVVIEGAGRAFSAGYDLDEEVDEGIESALAWRELLARDVAMTMRVWACPKPVIAQVHGYCLAGALELAMACDLVVAAEGTKLGEPEIRYGSAPVTLLMPALIGQKKTRELLLTGDLVDAAEAEQREWDAIVRADGVKAALAWRDRRYEERLGTRDRPER